MQKKVIILLTFILLLTGCGNEVKKKNKSNILSNTIDINGKDYDYVCTYDKKDEDNNYTVGAKYAIKIEDDLVSKIHSIEIIEANKPEIINDYESYINENYEKIKAYGGYEYTVNHENNRLITEVNINFNEFTIESFALNNPDIVNYLNEDYKLTADSVLNYYKDLDMECAKN